MPFDPERYKGEHNLFTGKQQEVLTRRSFTLAQRIHKDNYATVFFLDKTARMLGIGTEALYPKIYGNTPFQIGYLNIGAEKVELIARALYAGDVDTAIEDAKSKIAGIKDPVAFAQAFGQENVDQLREYLEPFPSGKILVVDDVSDSGTTRALTMNALQTFNPNSQYDFFPFLQSKTDTNPFWRYNEEGDKKISLPWRRNYTLRADNPGNRGSFFSLEQTGGNLPQAKKFQEEYVKMLLEAARNGYSPAQTRPTYMSRIRRLLDRTLDI